MSVFGAAWDHLDTPDITCGNDEGFSLNRWEVTLGIIILVTILFFITDYYARKAHKQAYLDEELDKRYGESDWLDIQSFRGKTRSLFGAMQIGLISTTRRKEAVIHYIMFCYAMIGFSTILILFQIFQRINIHPWHISYSVQLP